MIKNYLELNKTECINLHKFINRNDILKKTFDEMDKQMKSELYDYGNGSLLMIKNNEVVGKTSVILKDIINTKICYIVGLDLLENIKNDTNVIIDIICKSHEIGLKYGANEVYFGTNDERLVGILQNAGIRHEHLALVMKLNDNKEVELPFNIRKLTNENKLIYKDLYNNIFREVPHGATISDNWLNYNIEFKKDNNNYYIVSDINNKDIGILDTSIKNKIGTFDIGIAKEYRNMGYGKKILDTAINVLQQNSEVEEINLIVVSKNRNAYDMYMKRGFVHKKIYSYWYKTEDFFIEKIV